MKKLFTILVFFLTFSSIYSQTNTIWKDVHPRPTGGASISFAKLFTPNNWFISGNYGIHLTTTNAGTNFTYVTDKYGTTSTGFPKSTIGGAFFTNMKGVLIGTNFVLRTTNGGNTWDTVNNGIASFTYRYVSALDSNVGYICGYGYSTTYFTKYLKTTDAGLTWTLFDPGIPQLCNTIKAIDTNHIYISLGYGQTSPKPFAWTTNGGTNWQYPSITNPNFTNSNDIHFINESTGFACYLNGIAYRTTNSGVNWESINTPSTPPITILGSLNRINYSTTTNTLFIADANFIYSSTNLGTNWTPVRFKPELGSNSSISYLDVLGSNVLAVKTGGIFYSSNNGATFSEKTYSVSTATFFDIWADRTGNIIAVGNPTFTTPYEFDQIIRSTNYGQTWQKQPTDKGNASFYKISMLNAMTGYISGAGAIRKTTNGGTNWDTTGIYIPSSAQYRNMDFINANTGWAFGYTQIAGGNILKTTNGGTSWEVQNFGPTGSDQVINAADMLDENTGWLMNRYRTFKTTNGGTNWTALDSVTASAPREMKMFNANTGYFITSNYLFKTTNGATTWDTISTPIVYRSYQSMSFSDLNHGFITAAAPFSIKTIDGGLTWEIHQTGPNSSTSKIFSVSSDTAYLCGYGGSVKIFAHTATSVPIWSNKNPEDYSLEQNYPNPFNPVTTIKFSLPKASTVTLKVYDITGREIDILIDDLYINKGSIKYQFDGSKYSSGLYIYSLIIDNKYNLSKKMILVK